MSFYGCTPTTQGRALIAKLLATKTLTINRVMVGSGVVESLGNAVALTNLIAPVAAGTSTVPTYDGDTVHMTLEYRSDLNGGLENGFWLNEFGVFANDPDDGEILMYYGSLGEYPTYISAASGDGVDTSRFPISITVGENAEIVVDYNPEAWMTAEDVATYCNNVILPIFLENVAELIAEHNTNAAAHPAIQALITELDSRIDLLELRYDTDVTGNPFRVTFEDLEDVAVAGVWNEADTRIEFGEV